MSDKERNLLLSYMKEADRANENVVRCLLENPSCLEGEPQKEEAYQRALDYFKNKQEKSKSTENGSYAKALANQLKNFSDSYYQAEGGNKNDYARQMAIKVLNTAKFWLRRIPDQVKEEVFQIIYKYLEEQIHS